MHSHRRHILGARIGVGIDIGTARGNTDVHMGLNLAEMCRELLLVRTTVMRIAWVREISVGVDVSIAVGILCSYGGTLSGYVSRTFIRPRR